LTTAKSQLQASTEEKKYDNTEDGDNGDDSKAVITNQMTITVFITKTNKETCV
jgi:hypothetical protein